VVWDSEQSPLLSAYTAVFALACLGVQQGIVFISQPHSAEKASPFFVVFYFYFHHQRNYTKV
jgi:hypothetical protein